VNDVILAAVCTIALFAFHTWGPQFSVVYTDSMVPTYRPGDMVVVVPWSRPAVGDIAAFRTPVAPGAQHPAVVAHRIVDLDDRGFITKGDAATNADWWRVQPQQIEGRVVWWFPMMTLWCSAGALLGVGVTLLLWPARGIPPTADATSYSPHYLLSV